MQNWTFLRSVDGGGKYIDSQNWSRECYKTQNGFSYSHLLLNICSSRLVSTQAAKARSSLGAEQD